MERQTFILSSREKRANIARLISNMELGTLIEVRGAKRSDEQNDALHGLIDQILKQRPEHFGIKADKELYKAAFMHGLGKETRFVPTIDGDGVFPMGQRTSKLSVSECAQLITYILAWCARQEITVKHFDDDQGGAGANNPRAEVA